MPPVITATEYLVINAYPLATPAYRLTDLTALKDGPDVRGDDRPIPHKAGVKGLPRRINVTKRALPIIVFGSYKNDGTAHSNALVGLQYNIDELLTNVVNPVSTGNGTRAAVWHLPDGSTTRSADVTVISPLVLVRFGPIRARGVLEISIPAGVWT